jgi:hypothetical protein
MKLPEGITKFDELAYIITTRKLENEQGEEDRDPR